MYHEVRLSTEEKIKAWLNLCDFTFNLIRENFGEKQLRKRFKEMRKDQIEANYLILKGLSRSK